MKKHKKAEKSTQKVNSPIQQNPEEFEETINPNLRMKPELFGEKPTDEKAKSTSN